MLLGKCLSGREDAEKEPRPYTLNRCHCAPEPVPSGLTYGARITLRVVGHSSPKGKFQLSPYALRKNKQTCNNLEPEFQRQEGGI